MNSVLNRKDKKRVVTTLFLYLIIFLFACDFKSPDIWETPTWYMPLTIPIINKVYSFEGIVDSSMLFSDSISNVIQVVFGDSLPPPGSEPLGIPDETFNIDMSTGGLDAPDIGMTDIAIEVAGDITIEIPSTEIDDLGTFAIATTKGSCFPQSQIDKLPVLEKITSSIDMPITFETNDAVSIKRVIVTEGKWSMSITNNWSVPISVNFKLVNGETIDSILYNPLFSVIPPYEPAYHEAPITSSSTTTLDVNSAFNYSIDVSILNQDTNCPGYEHSYSLGQDNFDSESSCTSAYVFGSCTAYNGWIVHPEVDEKLIIEFSASFDKIGSVVADVSIDTPSADPIVIEIPAMEGISITRAKFAEYTTEYPNQFQFNITNGFIAELNMIMSYKNIFDYYTDSEGEINLTDSLIIPMKIKPNITLDTTISISDKFLAYGSVSEEAVKSIAIEYEVGIESGEYIIDVINDSIKIGVPSINSIEVTNLRLEYIAAVTDSLPFPPIPSDPIEGMPDGFSGFEFYDIIMEIEFFNEIGVPVGLNMELLGSKTGVVDTQSVSINAQIGAPYKDNYGCNFSNTGDTARTLIRLNKDFQITEYYCNTSALEPMEIDIDTLNSIGSGNNASIVDLMNFGPENFGIGGGVVIDGPGILSPGAEIWGTFTLIAPLAFVFKQPINIIPAETTPISPMDSSTAQQIDSSLFEAALNVTITNSSPLGGSLSLLISDSTIFPLFLDSLITGSWNSQLYDFNTMIWDTLEPPLIIDSISVTAIDSSDEESKALEVNFFQNDSLQFFVGRMFELKFPATDSIEYHLGYVNPEFPETYISSLIIDTTRMNWIITEENRNSSSMITFDSSPIQSMTDEETSYIPITFQTTNFIEVEAYLTLTLNIGGLGRENNLSVAKNTEN